MDDGTAIQDKYYNTIIEYYNINIEYYNIKGIQKMPGVES